MDKPSVYKQMTSSNDDLFQVLKREIGLKTACLPFAVKAMAALKTLGNLTEGEALAAANTFLANIQTLNQGGITAEDYDKIDFVKRGKTITVSARVEAFYRAAARKGYRITDSIVAVPKEDADTTYFKEHFHNGDIVYVLEDRRCQPDREITAQRLIDRYFSKFLCRLEVTNVQKNKRLVMTVCEMSIDELLNIAAVSEQGLYKSTWESYTNEYGDKKKRKVLTNELNSSTFWVLWTGEMVNKTIIRRALKRVREVLPELESTIYAFDDDSVETIPSEPDQIPFEIPMEVDNVDLNKLTPQQQADVAETLELFKANPKLASDMANEIKRRVDNGEDVQSIINTHYANISCIKMSAKLYPIISPYFDAHFDTTGKKS